MVIEVGFFGGGMSDRISVVIPVGRWEPFVRRAVNSAVQQGDCVEEILLIDNSKTSSGPKVNYGGDKVRVVQSEKIEDAAYARNLGIRYAKCDLVAVLDADDEYLDGHLDRAVQCLQENPSAILYYCSYKNLNNGQSEEIVHATKITGVKDVVVNCSIGHSCVVYRKYSIIRYPEIGRRHDYALWLTLLNAGCKFVFENEFGMLRYRESGSLSSGSRVSLFLTQASVTYRYSGLSWVVSTYLLSLFLIRTVVRKFL